MHSHSNLRVVAPWLVTGAAVGAMIAAYPRLIRGWFLHWGATEREIERPVPGDEFVSKPRIESTRAITIHAPTPQVWQWVIQVGQYRGGLYAGEWTEQLFGADVHNADEVMPEFQDSRVGDYVILYPNGPGYAIAALQAPQFLVLQTVNLDTGEFTRSAKQDGWHGTLTFLLEPEGTDTTRLVVRTRLDYEPGEIKNVAWGIVEPLNFALERQLLRGIKRRAEGAMHAHSPTQSFETVPPTPVGIPQREQEKQVVC